MPVKSEEVNAGDRARLFVWRSSQFRAILKGVFPIREANSWHFVTYYSALFLNATSYRLK